MRGTQALSGDLALTKASALASAVLVSLIVLSGVALACSTAHGGGGYQSPSLTLVVTSISKISGPSHIALTLVSPLPTSSATFKMGPFAPGDSVVISYTIQNTGNIPASLSTLGVSMSPSGHGFTATNGPVQSTLGPGDSFSSTISITFQSGLGNSYESSTATVTLQITGVSTTTTSCATTVTHTATKTVTETVTKAETVTVTTGKVTTKDQDSTLGDTALWVTTSSCTTITVTITSTITTTQTTYITVTKTVTTTTKHSSCT